MFPGTNNPGSMRRYVKGSEMQRTPLWIPASKYYFLASVGAIALFLLVRETLGESDEETSYFLAVIVSGAAFTAAVFVREVLLRNARNRFLSAKRLDRSLRESMFRRESVSDSKKITLEQNALILRRIREKSEAAKILGKLAEAHKEVVDLCEEYLAVTARELSRIAIGSPRLPAFRKGSEVVGRCHRYHMLLWAEIESRSLTREAGSRAKISEKLEIGHKALEIIDLALMSYPKEIRLLDSRQVLRDFLASVRVSNWIDKAERAHFKGNNESAISHYQDALFDLERNYSRSNDRELAGKRIMDEIKRLKHLLEHG